MGTTFRWDCPSCRYTAEASGGRDEGFVTRTESSVCSGCRDVVDVATHRRGDGGEWVAVAARCPECGSGGLTFWPEHHPCPRCGDAMDEGQLVALWD